MIVGFKIAFNIVVSMHCMLFCKNGWSWAFKNPVASVIRGKQIFNHLRKSACLIQDYVQKMASCKSAHKSVCKMIFKPNCTQAYWCLTIHQWLHLSANDFNGFKQLLMRQTSIVHLKRQPRNAAKSLAMSNYFFCHIFRASHQQCAK